MERESVVLWYFIENPAWFDAANDPGVYKYKPKQMSDSQFRMRNYKNGLWPPETFSPFRSPFFSKFFPPALCFSALLFQTLQLQQWEVEREVKKEAGCAWLEGLMCKMQKGSWGTKGGRFIGPFICDECRSSPDPVLVSQWRLTAGTTRRDPECPLLSSWRCESGCVGKRYEDSNENATLGRL